MEGWNCLCRVNKKLSGCGINLNTFHSANGECPCSIPTIEETINHFLESERRQMMKIVELVLTISYVCATVDPLITCVRLLSQVSLTSEIRLT